VTAGPVLRADALSRAFGPTRAIQGVSLSLAEGEQVALQGPSGCGKSTLLHMLGLLDRPSAGAVFLDGVDLWAADATARAHRRLVGIGFVFQQNNLLGYLSARENVALPRWRAQGDRGVALREADGWLERLGLGSRKDSRAAQLSGGEAQRVAIARALVNQPRLLLADEPTGSLDSQASKAVLEALLTAGGNRTTVLVATHDDAVAGCLGRRLVMRDGEIVGAP